MDSEVLLNSSYMNSHILVSQLEQLVQHNKQHNTTFKEKSEIYSGKRMLISSIGVLDNVFFLLCPKFKEYILYTFLGELN